MSQLHAFAELAAPDQLLVERAAEVSKHAYAPYSLFSVGAAVRTRSGGIFCGANLENAAIGCSICAEVAAVANANTAGDFAIETIAIVGRQKDSPRYSKRIVTPCGRCRQVISEAAALASVDVRVLCCEGDLRRVLMAKISELLPAAFGPENLGQDASATRIGEG